MAVLVTYASKHGATEGIARFIAERLRERGMDVEARPVDAVGEIGHPDAIVLGSAVYAGSWMKQAKAFVEDHAEELSRVPVWLFSSGPVGDTKDVGVADEQLEELKVLSARDHHLFAGALDKSKLSARWSRPSRRPRATSATGTRSRRGWTKSPRRSSSLDLGETPTRGTCSAWDS